MFKKIVHYSRLKLSEKSDQSIHIDETNIRLYLGYIFFFWTKCDKDKFLK